MYILSNYAIVSMEVLFHGRSIQDSAQNLKIEQD